MNTLKIIKDVVQLGNTHKEKLIRDNDKYIKQFNENNHENEYQKYTSNIQGDNK